MTTHFEVRSDLVALGTDEDGEDTVGFSWYLVGTDEGDGRCFAHDHTVVTRWEEEPEVFVGLLSRVIASEVSPKDRPHWQEIEPSYCSPYWAAWDRGIARREREDEINGL